MFMFKLSGTENPRISTSLHTAVAKLLSWFRDMHKYKVTVSNPIVPIEALTFSRIPFRSQITVGKYFRHYSL